MLPGGPAAATQPLSLCRCPACGLVQLGETAVIAADCDTKLPPALEKALHKSLPPHARVAVIGNGNGNDNAAGESHTVLVTNAIDSTADFAGLFAEIDRLSGLHTRLIIQTPDLRRIAEQHRYAAVRHARQCYFDAGSLAQLLDRYGWAVRGSVSLAADGSLVAWAARQEWRDASWVFPIAAGNLAAALPERAIRAFAASWHDACLQTRTLIEDLLAAGHTVAAFGPAREVVAALGPAGLEAGWLKAIYDPAAATAGCSSHGGIPVRSPGRAALDQPGVLLVADPREEAALSRGASQLTRAARTFLSLSTLPLQPIPFPSPLHPHYPEAA